MLQEVANSPDLDPTLTFNVGGLKSTRRSSFGRRVSFSASTKIKEFRTDGPDLTTWNSTYEEERSNLNSDSSSQRNDSDVLADKTFCGNDDMEETGVLPKEKSNIANTDFLSQRNDSNLLDNKTLVGNEDMEVTRILPNPQAGQVLSSLREKFGSKSAKEGSNDTLSTTKTGFGSVTINSNEAMDMTCTMSSLREKFGSKFDKSEIGNEEADIAKTANSKSNESRMEMTTISSSNSTDKDAEMEITAAVPTAVTLVQKNTVTEDMFDKTSDKVKESAFDNMEMTCSLSASLKEKIRSNLEPKNSNCAKPLNQSPKPLDESSMEMTLAVVVPKQPAQMQNDTENMEFTCALPIARKMKVNTISEPENINSLKPSNIEESCMNMTEVLVCSKNTVGNQDDMENMEMTCAVPTGLKEKNGSVADPEISSNQKRSNLEESGMEMTEAVVLKKITVQTENEIENMEMTCALPNAIKEKKSSNANISSTMKVLKPDESGMEMTEALPFQKESVPNQGEMENMEMTCAIPTAIKGATVESKLNISSNMKLTKLDESNMELTKAVVPPKIAAHNQSHIENMEITCALPSLVKEQVDIDAETMKKPNDSCMEMTEAVVPAKNLVQDAKTTTKMSDTLENSMEMTEAVAPHMISLPRETIETAKTTKDNDQEISSLTNIAQSEAEMEMTCALSTKKNITGLDRSNDASQRLSIRVGTDDNDMEMTEAITHLSKNTVQKETTLQLEKSAPELEMEETCAISSTAVKEIMDLPDIESSKSRDDTHDDMEMTEAVMNIENTTAQNGPASPNAVKNENNREFAEVSTVSDTQNLDRSVPVAIVTSDENHVELPSSKSTTIAQNESMEMSATLNFQQKFGEPVTETKAFSSNCSLQQNEAIQETPTLKDTKSQLCDKEKEEKRFSQDDDCKMETVLDEPEYRMHQTSRNCSFINETNAVETEDVQSMEVIPPTIATHKENDVSCEEENLPMSNDNNKSLEDKSIEIPDNFDEYTEKSHQRRKYMDGLKRFIEDLAHPSDPANEGPSPAKRARLSEGVTSVFQQAVVPFESRSDHGHWTLLNENENSATFGFAMGTWQLQFILGHSLSASGGQGLGIKHWAIRKAILNINRHPESDPSIKLADYLFSKDWTPEKLSSVFKTTKNLQKGLGLLGADVSNAMRFVLDMHEVEGNHCKFDVDVSDMKLRVEFFSVAKIYNFAIEISYGLGFKHAKYEGTNLIPLVSNDFQISTNPFKKIVNSCTSGWSFLRNLVETLDQYIIESERN